MLYRYPVYCPKCAEPNRKNADTDKKGPHSSGANSEGRFSRGPGDHSGAARCDTWNSIPARQSDLRREAIGHARHRASALEGLRYIGGVLAELAACVGSLSRSTRAGGKIDPENQAPRKGELDQPYSAPIQNEKRTRLGSHRIRFSFRSRHLRLLLHDDCPRHSCVDGAVERVRSDRRESPRLRSRAYRSDVAARRRRAVENDVVRYSR